jgi:hypothetical protein
MGAPAGVADDDLVDRRTGSQSEQINGRAGQPAATHPELPRFEMSVGV